MVRTLHTLPNLQRAAIERLGLRQLPLDPEEYGQVVEGSGGVGVVRTQHTLPNLQRAAIERLGLRQLPLDLEEYGQVVEAWAVSGWSGPSTRSRISSARR